MPTGTLKSWNDDRGFGFIATPGGRELFVHISAFPRDGLHPKLGETLTYEIGRGRDGKLAAVRVHRQGIQPSPAYSPARRTFADRWVSPAVFILLTVLGVVVYAYLFYEPREAQVSSQGESRCDGRTRCSQMNSCSEARFFMANCPGTQMDGDNDGVPCEDQWCSSP